MSILPLVSVVIPTYNAGKFIGETLKSVLKQTYINLEVLVVDDGSTDDTAIVTDAIAINDNRVKFIPIEHAGRPSIPRNIGIKYATGEYVAFVDSDDLWMPEKIALQVTYLETHPGDALVYAPSATFGAVSIFSPYYEVLPAFGRNAKNQLDLILKGNSITCSTVMTRREILIKENGFDEDPLLQIEDYDLWIRLTKYGGIGFIPKLLCKYRVHESQFSGSWELRKERLEYMAKLRNLPLPQYKFYRNKSIFHKILRNAYHVYSFIVFSALRVL